MVGRPLRRPVGSGGPNSPCISEARESPSLCWSSRARRPLSSFAARVLGPREDLFFEGLSSPFFGFWRVFLRLATFPVLVRGAESNFTAVAGNLAGLFWR